MLEETADLSPSQAEKRLRKAGFVRTLTAITVKRKRLAIRIQRDGYTGRELAELIGYDERTVSRWIRMGRLKAAEYGQERGDGRVNAYRVTDKDLREFIIQNPTVLELRRIPAANQPWLIELLTCRGPTA